MHKYRGVRITCISLRGLSITHNSIPHSSRILHVFLAHADSIPAHPKCPSWTLTALCSSPSPVLKPSRFSRSLRSPTLWECPAFTASPHLQTYCTSTFLHAPSPYFTKKIKATRGELLHVPCCRHVSAPSLLLPTCLCVEQRLLLAACVLGWPALSNWSKRSSSVPPWLPPQQSPSVPDHSRQHSPRLHHHPLRS